MGSGSAAAAAPAGIAALVQPLWLAEFPSTQLCAAKAALDTAISALLGGQQGQWTGEGQGKGGKEAS